MDRTKKALALGALLLSALALGGCSMSIADLPSLGTPADAPERPKDVPGYLPVHDLPPDRSEPELPPAERAKIQAELVAARDRQASAVGAKETKAKDTNAKETKAKVANAKETKAKDANAKDTTAK